MLEKLGRRAAAAPFMLPILICCILGLAMTPMLRSQMTDIPFAIVTLDKGSEMPFTDVNVGDELVERLLDGESLGAVGDSGESADDDAGAGMMQNATIAWTKFDTEQELRDALAANEFYGGIVIPADFTAQQMRSATGLGGAPTLKVLLNDAKNPMLAQQMGPNLKSQMLQAGISVDVEEVNAADIGGGSMAPMMAVQMMVMPLVIMSLIGGILLSVVLWPRQAASRRERLVALVKQLVSGTVLSALVALLATGIDVWFGGLDLPMERLYPFVWLACGAMIATVAMLCDLVLPLGALVGVTTFALGMSCAMLAFEMLPPFWQEWVYPWVPQRFLGDGVRAIVYLGADALASQISYWTVLYQVAGVAAVLALLMPTGGRPRGKRAEGKGETGVDELGVGERGRSERGRGEQGRDGQGRIGQGHGGQEQELVAAGISQEGEVLR